MQANSVLTSVFHTTVVVIYVISGVNHILPLISYTETCFIYAAWRHSRYTSYMQSHIITVD